MVLRKEPDRNPRQPGNFATMDSERSHNFFARTGSFASARGLATLQSARYSPLNFAAFGLTAQKTSVAAPSGIVFVNNGPTVLKTVRAIAPMLRLRLVRMTPGCTA